MFAVYCKSFQTFFKPFWVARAHETLALYIQNVLARSNTEIEREYIKLNVLKTFVWVSLCARKALKKNGIPAREEDEVSPTKTRLAVKEGKTYT